MNNLKKLLCMLMAAMMIFALAACGEKDSEKEEKKDTAAVETKEDKDEKEEATEAEETEVEEDASIVGEYVATAITGEGVTITEPEALEGFSMSVKEDGTIDMTLDGSTESVNYAVTDNTISITDETGVQISGTLEDGKIVLDFGELAEGMSITFEKK